MKTFIVIFLGTLCTALGEALLSRGMKQVGDLSVAATTSSSRAVEALTNPSVLAGIAFMAAFFVLYSVALSWADLSFVQPLTAMTFVFGAVLARFWLGEDVSMWRWAGVACIALGIFLVSRDPNQLTSGG